MKAVPVPREYQMKIVDLYDPRFTEEEIEIMMAGYEKRYCTEGRHVIVTVPR